jgi:hypothetical protein
MLIKIKINKETLATTTDDELAVINHVSDNGTEIQIEISKPDPETEQPWQP